MWDRRGLEPKVDQRKGQGPRFDGAANVGDNDGGANKLGDARIHPGAVHPHSL